MEQTICKNCRWYGNQYGVYVCTFPELGRINYRDGTISYPYCVQINTNGNCKLYEEKPKGSLWLYRIFKM